MSGATASRAEALGAATEMLRAAGVDAPRRDARLLMQHALGLSPEAARSGGGFAIIRHLDKTAPVVVLGDLDDDEVAVKAVKRGAQDYLAGNFPLSIETPNAIATQVLEAVLFGLDVDELETFPERVRAVTPNDIQRVARNFLRPDTLAIVLVGNAAAFVDDLPGVGFDDYEVVPIASVDLYGIDAGGR